MDTEGWLIRRLAAAFESAGKPPQSKVCRHAGFGVALSFGCASQSRDNGVQRAGSGSVIV